MPDRARELLGSTQTREISFRAETLNAEARTVEIAFSSEGPVERWWGTEVLSHAAGAVRMSRLKDGAPLLLQHDPNRQIGVVESARIDQDRIGRAQVRFSRGALGQEVMQDVADGIRSKISVGYLVHDLKLESSSDSGDTYRVTDWEPLELSFVSIPADNAVGVGRALPHHARTPMDTETLVTETAEVSEVRAEPIAPAATAPAAINPQAEQIREVGRFFGLAELAEREILLGTDLSAFRALVRQHRPEPVPSAPRIEMRVPYAGTLNAFRPELYDGKRSRAEEAAYRAGQWARAMLFGDTDAARWCRDHGMPMSQRVLTGLTAGQSVLIPDELVLPIISLREQYGIARRFCYVHPMVTDTASVPRDTGDVTAYFVGREQAPTASDPTFDNIELVSRNVAVETRISNDYAADSVINLADHVAEKHARAFAVKEDNCLFNGDGTSSYGGIVGIRTAILSKAGAVDAATGNDTFAEITATDLGKVMGTLPDLPGINPSWFVSKVGMANMFNRLKEAVGGNTGLNLSSGAPDTWSGYDIVTSAAMPKVLTDLSDVAMAIFGDLRMGVIFGDRRGMTMMVDPYSLSSYQQTKIISSERFDINVHGVGDASNAGPIVALIGE